MIVVDGANEIVNRLDQLAQATKITQKLKEACLIVERAAKQKCPSNTGDLRASIESDVDGTVGTVGTPLQYAPYVEYGTGLFAENGNGRTDVPWNYQDAEGKWHSTSGQPPQPFLIPALNENREKIIELLREGIKND